MENRQTKGLGIGAVMLLLLGISLGGYAASPIDTDALIPGIEILQAEFGIINSQGEFLATNQVPMQKNQTYGWQVELKTLHPQIQWREELILPKPPKTWGQQPDKNIKAQQNTAVTIRKVTPQQGIIGNFWTVAPSDPAGDYMIHLYIEDKKVKTFLFTVK